MTTAVSVASNFARSTGATSNTAVIHRFLSFGSATTVLRTHLALLSRVGRIATVLRTVLGTPVSFPFLVFAPPAWPGCWKQKAMPSFLGSAWFQVDAEPGLIC